ncbi:MAG: CDP-glycerol glycerophosphotransferase family protein [Clostridia bacterium]|nr:CDP-glycerol glycerophosphotransferase family protein [Clostridia bacterium]
MILYIDPGTGSMLFTILIAVVGSLVYLLRSLKLRLGLLTGRRKNVREEEAALPLVIFSDHKRYWNVFEPICDELERRGQETFYMTESPDDPALEKPYTHIHAEWIGEGSKAYTRLNFLKARMLLSTTPGLDVYQWKRSRDIPFYVHIPHAPGDVTRYRMFGLDYYDAVLLSGEYQIGQLRRLEQSRGLPEKELRIVGITYLDQMRKRLETLPPVPPRPDGKKTVLLAPSWGASGILSVYGGKILDALLATDFHLIVRPHPQSFSTEKTMLEDLMRRYPEGPQLEWNRDNDNFEVLRRSDILISDFSGVMFDFSLVFDKPIIYADTSFDKGPYDCYWLDENLWTFEVLPKLGHQLSRDNLSRIREVIEDGLANPAFQAARDEARAETWQHPGEAADRVVDYLMEKLAESGGGGDK